MGRPLRLVGVAALLGVAGASAVLLAGAPGDPPAVMNGLVAMTVAERVPGGDVDTDIWLTGLGGTPIRAIGTATDDADERCPAFSPDGRRLAYGTSRGEGTRYSVDFAGDDRPPDYRDAALVIADVTQSGAVSVSHRLALGDGVPPPCPAWSPDGDLLAFAAARTSPVNPTTSARGSEVRIVRPADMTVTVVPDLLATDLEWSPDGSQLAIASGTDALVSGEMLRDSRVLVWSRATGTATALDATTGATELAWAPDGRRIAYPTSGGLTLLDLASGTTELLASRQGILHGFGLAWAPVGDRIAFLRPCASDPTRPGLPCRETYEAVVVDLAGRRAGGRADPEVVPLHQEMEGRPARLLFPERLTWSPDGRYLLVLGSGEGAEGIAAAVPIEPDGQTILLGAMPGLGAGEAYPDVAIVADQVWGRAPAP